MKTFSTAAIANGLLERAHKENYGITPMKMQKLLYIAHGYGLVELDKSIINELFEAWQFGPVLNSLYHACKRYGLSNISDPIKGYDYKTGNFGIVPPPDDEQVNEILDFVWQTYGREDAFSLSDWTHERGGPWDKVTNGGNRILHNEQIPNELIKQYFQQSLNGQP